MCTFAIFFSHTGLFFGGELIEISFWKHEDEILISKVDFDVFMPAKSILKVIFPSPSTLS